MALNLPRKSEIECGEVGAQRVYRELTGVIAGHPGATTTYRFYEEIDAWLGPWGPSGYPIGYGKFYNIEFSTNRKLMENATTKQWVWKTTIRLQEALRDFVVAKTRDCSIRNLSETELRRAAFDSHPQAYDRGGLTMVAMVAPELVPTIAIIPGAEFDPRSENFLATVDQVWETIKRIMPQMVGNGLAALAGPAHTGIFRRAMALDNRQLMEELAIGRELGMLKNDIEAGRYDSVLLLDRIVENLSSREFPDQGFARAAADVIQVALSRRAMLATQLERRVQSSPPVRDRLRQRYPEALTPQGAGRREP